MKFREFKRFSGAVLTDIITWLKSELNSAMRELYIGLHGLDFRENFRSFTWTGTLAASETRQIPHPFGAEPSGMLIFKQVGNGLIDASATKWTNDVVYLRNNSASNSVELTVIFFA